MTEEKKTQVRGYDGRMLSLVNIPPANTARWTIRRKSEVVAAVRGGLLTLEEACERYKLTPDEFNIWAKLLDRYGEPGMRVTRMQQYRGG